jgi:hypothetical protein
VWSILCPPHRRVRAVVAKPGLCMRATPAGVRPCDTYVRRRMRQSGARVRASECGWGWGGRGHCVHGCAGSAAADVLR